MPHGSQHYYNFTAGLLAAQSCRKTCPPAEAVLHALLYACQATWLKEVLRLLNLFV